MQGGEGALLDIPVVVHERKVGLGAVAGFDAVQCVS